jgi:methylated-DNA-[protein]-cysteine S-methyltransferase
MTSTAVDEDVAYATVDSPIGPLVLAATRTGLVRLAYGDDGTEAVLRWLSERLPARVVEQPSSLDVARRELDEYFGGARHAFDLPLDLRLCTAFGRRVLAVTAAIPYGSVSTYDRVAAAAGAERAGRAVGGALAANPVPIVVPCHRVVPAGGGVGHYAGGPRRKVALLRLEGAVESPPAA